ncbi:hypothetical protein EV193_11720 [Herbihabitans rhizosphaerae]|uniref:Uncharacterized protein n=1 Tax=Herbihabitans rhizosphaerae TaxID=1872711 RepID=A0A4Q7KC00_9PSEU|nr:hypothetical protein EV193_11720 [Herbihabitans rhizosphaerae]
MKHSNAAGTRAVALSPTGPAGLPLPAVWFGTAR